MENMMVPLARQGQQQFVTFAEVAARRAVQEAAKYAWRNKDSIRGFLKRKTAKKYNAVKNKKSNGMPSEQMARKKDAGSKRSARGNMKKRKVKKGKSKRRTKSLKSRIVALEQQAPGTAVKVCKNDTYNNLQCGDNACAYASVACFYVNHFEANLDNLKFANLATSGALEYDANTSTLSAEFQFRNLYSKLTVRNASQTEVDVDIYCMSSKGALTSGQDPLTLLTADGTNVEISTAESNYLAYPSDFPAVKDNWKIESHVKSRLQGGDELDLPWSKKTFSYNPETNDVLSRTYLEGHTLYLIRVQGTIAHDVTNDVTETGLCSGGVDWRMQRRWEIHYPSNMPSRTHEISLGGETFTNDAEQVGPNVDELKDEL